MTKPTTPPPSKGSENKKQNTQFQANSLYFTISIYVVAVVAIAAVIFKVILSFEDTLAWIKNVLNLLMP